MNTSIEKQFNFIKKFVNELTDMFGENNQSLLLYNHLLNKLNSNDTILIHLNIFEKFANDNRDAILSEDITKFISNDITYRNSIKIEMKNILIHSEDKAPLWKYLTFILFMFNKEDENIKEKFIVKKGNENNTEKNLESFINKTKAQIDEKINPNETNPMNIFSSLMKDGFINELCQSVTNSIKSGELDLSVMVNQIQPMLSSMTGDGDNNMLQMLLPLLSGLNNTNTTTS